MRALVLLLLAGCATSAPAGGDPLPSWNEGAAKSALLDFVRKAAGVPVEERIAVFDNDGTLWAEQPMYFQLAFILDRVKALAPAHPGGRRRSPSSACSRARSARPSPAARRRSWSSRRPPTAG